MSAPASSFCPSQNQAINPTKEMPAPDQIAYAIANGI